ETAERRATIPRDQRRRAHATSRVRAVLIERQPDERLDAGQEDGALFQAVLGLEREIVVTRHALPRPTGSRPAPDVMIRAREGSGNGGACGHQRLLDDRRPGRAHVGPLAPARAGRGGRWVRGALSL